MDHITPIRLPRPRRLPKNPKGVETIASLETIGPVPHGDIDYGELARLGLQPHDIIDFSANSNPYGAHPDVLKAVREAVTSDRLLRYPDRECLALRETIAQTEGVSPDQILPTNGANELIQLIALALVKPNSQHLILTPTFGEYARAITVLGGNVMAQPALAPEYRFDLNAIVIAIQKIRPDTIWVCNPNNPTGDYLPPDSLNRIIAAAANTPLIIDESYLNFVQAGVESKVIEPTSEYLIVLRSLTKEHGLAGLRLGYALAQPSIINRLRTVQPAWSVNTLAQVAGVTALQPDVAAQQRHNLARLHTCALELWQKLSTIGYTVLPTTTTYALVEVGQATTFRRNLLLNHGLLVRDGTSFGLPAHVRIASQLPEQNEQLLKALNTIAKEK